MVQNFIFICKNILYHTSTNKAQKLYVCVCVYLYNRQSTFYIYFMMYHENALLWNTCTHCNQEWLTEQHRK